MTLRFTGVSVSSLLHKLCSTYVDCAYKTIWVRHAQQPAFPLMFYQSQSLAWSFYQMVPNPWTYPKSFSYDFLISSTTDILLKCIQYIVCFLLLQHFTVFPKSVSKSSFFSIVFQLSHLKQQLNTTEPSQQHISLNYGNWYTPFLPRSNSFMQMFSPAVFEIITDSLRGKSKQQQCSLSLPS